VLFRSAPVTARLPKLIKVVGGLVSVVAALELVAVLAGAAPTDIVIPI
jgi:hypothetical protein